jgi:acetolactate decarboxylase
MKTRIAFVVTLLIACADSAWAAETSAKSDEVFVVSTVGALMEGVYGGVISCGELRKHGNFGLGSFEGLDGELIVLDGKVYKATADEKVATVDDAAQVTYAVNKHFKVDQVFNASKVKALGDLGTTIAENAKHRNALLAVKVTGKFQSIKLRAVPRQNEPFPRLSEVAKQQREWELHDVEGTLIGFRFSKYTGELSVPGFHFHFLSNDRTQGGHVLDVQFLHALIECDLSRRLDVVLPNSHAFDDADLDSDHAGGIHEAEGSQKK